MKNIFYSIATIAILFSTSCERLLMEKEPTTTPTSIFEQVWTFTDQNYSFFDYKGINWDSVKTVYQNKISDDMSEEALFDTLANMLFLLRDGHVNLQSDFNRSRNWHWYLDYPTNYDYALLERNYFKDQQQYIGSFILYDFNDVGYINYESFMNGVSPDDMDYVIDKFKNYKGLIIDVRNNGGGSLANVYAIANYFTDQDVDVAFEQDKIGPGHEDFDNPTTLSLYHSENTESFTKPVVILTNRLCFSATNFFVTMMRQLPNVTIIGDNTGGGGGIPTFTELSNGWIIRVSSSRLFTLDGFNVENGIEPDIKVEQSIDNTNNGVDTLLETALTFLRNK